jgi:hypothetical protein
MQLTASKLAIYASGVCHRTSSLRASRSGLAAADLVSLGSTQQPPLMHVELDDPARPDVFALLDEHLRNMHELSPP